MYLRQSQDRDGNQFAVERQREDVRRYIELRGWTVTGEYVDNDVSATKSKKRPAYTKMLQQLAGCDVIVARHMDRLLRKLSDFVGLLETCDAAKVAIVTVADGIDTSTDGGRTTAGILASVAEGEVRRKSARQRSAAEQAAKQGRWLGGRRPFGYQADGITPHETEAGIVRELYARALAGDSMGCLARWLNGNGITTTLGNPWTGPLVSQMLNRERYVGQRTYRGEVVNDAGVALVDRDVWEAVSALLRAPGRQVATPARKHLLTGLLICGVCKSRMGASVNGHPIYKCKSGGCVSRRMDIIDREATNLVLAAMRHPSTRAALSAGSGELAPLRKREAEILSGIDELAVDKARGLLTARQVQVATKTLEADLCDVRAQLGGIVRTSAAAELAEDPSQWEGYSLDRKRLVISELVEFTLRPGGRGGPWRSELLEHRWLVANIATG